MKICRYLQMDIYQTRKARSTAHYSTAFSHWISLCKQTKWDFFLRKKARSNIVHNKTQVTMRLSRVYRIYLTVAHTKLGVDLANSFPFNWFSTEIRKIPNRT